MDTTPKLSSDEPPDIPNTFGVPFDNRPLNIRLFDDDYRTALKALEKQYKDKIGLYTCPEFVKLKQWLRDNVGIAEADKIMDKYV